MISPKLANHIPLLNIPTLKMYDWTKRKYTHFYVFKLVFIGTEALRIV